MLNKKLTGHMGKSDSFTGKYGSSFTGPFYGEKSDFQNSPESSQEIITPSSFLDYFKYDTEPNFGIFIIHHLMAITLNMQFPFPFTLENCQA